MEKPLICQRILCPCDKGCVSEVGQRIPKVLLQIHYLMQAIYKGRDCFYLGTGQLYLGVIRTITPWLYDVTLHQLSVFEIFTFITDIHRRPFHKLIVIQVWLLHTLLQWTPLTTPFPTLVFSDCLALHSGNSLIKVDRGKFYITLDQNLPSEQHAPSKAKLLPIPSEKVHTYPWHLQHTGEHNLE